ncbi:MAG: hypothetical protein ACFFFG_05990 [Candidatus Thorarchaeota archaeon]
MSRKTTILLVLSGAAAAIGLVSAIGSTCTTFDPQWWKVPSFSIIADFQLVFILTYIVTWLVALAWGVLFWALRVKKPWFYNSALITSIAGFLSGFIPVAILFYEWWASYGVTGMVFTPSWFRTIINAVILIVLLLPVMRTEIQSMVEEKATLPGMSTGTQISDFAFVLFGFGIVLMLQPYIMPATHIINGVNVGYDFEELQFLGGILTLFLGVLIRLIGYLLNMFYSPIPTSTQT